MQLTISNVSKTYANGLKALTDVNLTIAPGMFGLLGPNGAGKSTLMRTIATLQDPDTGTIMLGDIDVIKQKEELRKVLGYLPQDFGFYPKVNAVDMLHHFAVLKGINNKSERKEICDALLHQTNLYDARKRNLSEYSGGMRQRFGIAQALLGSPKLIIVDEPTAGLDPAERNRFHNILSDLGENIIVILSTHIVEDIKNLCPRMVIMNRGQVLLDGKPSDTIEQMRNTVWKLAIDKNELNTYKDKYKVISAKVVDGKVLIHVKSDVMPDAAFSVVEPDLEDVYFSNIL
ncbi:MAG: multidrug transporter ATP-binding protein [Bacteroidetes bacterium]|jgi:ABC-type multidrug transport system ATPase subunit|nr:multidrug transporter ATP-binding protein [Bacteroidota bacterium]